MKNVLSVIILLTGFVGVIVSCSKDGDDGNNNDTCANVAKTWSSDVSPIIQTFCNQAACHDAASTNGPGPLTNYTQVFAARTAIRDQVAAGLMPQNATLTAAQKQTIICWVNSGAPNN